MRRTQLCRSDACPTPLHPRASTLAFPHPCGAHCDPELSARNDASSVQARPSDVRESERSGRTSAGFTTSHARGAVSLLGTTSGSAWTAAYHPMFLISALRGMQGANPEIDVQRAVLLLCVSMDPYCVACDARRLLSRLLRCLRDAS